MSMREGFTKQGALALAVSAIIALGLGGYGFFNHNQMAGLAIGNSPATANSTASNDSASTPSSSAVAVADNAASNASAVDPSAPASGTTPGGSSSSSAGAQNASSTSSNQSLGPKLSDTSYVRAAYQIYPGPLTDQTRQAMAGFSVQFDQQNGKVLMTLTVDSQSQSPITRTINPTDKVYFIETRFGDDSGYNGEFNLGDDGVVITNADGYILQSL